MYNNLEKRFWKKVLKRGSDKCWNFLAQKDKDGYGKFWVSKYNRSVAAHRIAYEITYGIFPSKLIVCHKCDNPSCCNPNHLFLGTQADNIRDKVLKNRQAKGENHGWHIHPESILEGEKSSSHKIKDFQVLEIRKRYTEECLSYKELANIYGISKSQVANIIKCRQRIL